MDRDIAHEALRAEHERLVDETTAIASSYYRKLPDLAGRTVMLIDPMLATGGSAKRALEDIYSLGCARVLLVCIVAAPEGAVETPRLPTRRGRDAIDSPVLSTTGSGHSGRSIGSFWNQPTWRLTSGICGKSRSFQRPWPGRIFSRIHESGGRTRQRGFAAG